QFAQVKRVRFLIQQKTLIEVDGGTRLDTSKCHRARVLQHCRKLLFKPNGVRQKPEPKTLMLRLGSIKCDDSEWSKPNSPIVRGVSTDRFRIIGLTDGTRNINPISRAERCSLLQSA